MWIYLSIIKRSEARHGMMTLKSEYKAIDAVWLRLTTFIVSLSFNNSLNIKQLGDEDDVLK